MLDVEKTVKGFVHLEVTNTALHKTWAFNIPLKAKISVGAAVDDTECLNISLKKWETMTQENLTTKEFTILNNCRVEGNDIPINYLKARLKWTSNPMGNVQINVIDPKTGSSASEILRDGDWITLLETLRPSEESEYYGLISFAPSQGHLNEEAEFKVEFDAVTSTDAGPKSVGASNPINAKILITTLTQCVEFEPGADTGIRIGRSEDEKTFKVSTKKCGPVPVKLSFCRGDQGCKGGTSEGEIEVTPWNPASLTEQDKEITVRRVGNVAGLYGITVDAQVPGRGWQKIATYDVIVEPKNGKYFYLDKYNFVLLGKGAKDSTILYNEMLQENVKVNTTTCELADAMSTGEFIGVGAASAVGTLLTSQVNLVAGTINGVEYAAASYNALYGGVTSGYGELAGDSVSGLGGGGFGGLPIVGIILGAAIGYATGGVQGAIVGAASSIIAFAAFVACGDDGWGLLCALVASIAGSLLGSLFGGGEECTDTSVDLVDYVINLKGTSEDSEHYIPSDALPLLLEKHSGDFDASWKTDVSDIYYNSDSSSGDTQEAGIVFENKGIERDEPLYDLLTVQAKEHIHGDTTHKDAEVDCKGNSDFANLWITCDETTKTYYQKFHVRFKTRETKQTLPKIQFDTYDCSTSTLMGRTGEGALPKVKLDWSWITGKGIEYDSCDAENLNGVYCDATQFSIAFTKRMYVLDQFFKKNQYFENICPKDASQQQAGGFSQLVDSGIQVSGVDGNFDITGQGRVLDANKVMVKSAFKERLSSNTTKISVVIANNTGSNAAVNLSANVSLLNNNPAGSCNIQQISIAPFAQVTKTCELNLAVGGYKGQLSLSQASGNGANIDSNIFYLTFYVLAEDPNRDSLINLLNCDVIRTTDISMGKPIIEQFVDAAGNVNWTSEMPDKNALRKLLHWDVLLMRDALSLDFRKDFVNYYETQSLADASTFFKDDRVGFKKYFLDENQLKFANKYFDSERIWAAGRYRADIGAYYTDDWRLFDSNANMKAAVGITFYLLKEPSPNFPFYSSPLDGLVGVQGDSLNRQGYGSQYTNQDNVIIIDNSPAPAKTNPDAGSNAVNKVKTRVEENLKNLNNDLTRRGNLLSIQTISSNEKEIEFSSNLATPVVMKITASEKTNDAFGAFYSLMQNNSPVIVGNSLALWSAGGNCYDFSGLPLIQVFDEKPDRKAIATDTISDWEKAYVVECPNVEMIGNNYLRSIFYTPRNQSSVLHAMHPTNALSFYTPDT
ncbi:MAG: hypothetical protein HZA83_02060, partial [Thaumarchaeota archaeon]|nr:hypothetical protein [Nitrososphaerota archaeon]